MHTLCIENLPISHRQLIYSRCMTATYKMGCPIWLSIHGNFGGDKTCMIYARDLSRKYRAGKWCKMSACKPGILCPYRTDLTKVQKLVVFWDMTGNIALVWNFVHTHTHERTHKDVYVVEGSIVSELLSNRIFCSGPQRFLTFLLFFS